MASRQRLRLTGYDYGRAGAYFVTVCAVRRGPVFGFLQDQAVGLRLAGKIVAAHLSQRMGGIRGVAVPASIVMPDHIHAVVILDEGAPNLSTLIGSFKSASAREIVRRCDGYAAPVWQRGFHDHIVRDEADFNRVCEYIATNPRRSSRRTV